jgi:hypothetical protein
MILDCSNYESTKESLSNIFDVDEETLKSKLISISTDNNDIPPEQVIYNDVCEAFGAPSNNLRVAWFHGSRVEDESLFYEQGILTKSEAREIIEPRLNELTEGLESSGTNPFALSLSGKQGPDDEGPFAYLIRDVVIQANTYTQSPEIVEDISGDLLGKNFYKLVKRFQEVTSPCIVSFHADSRGDELKHALFFVKLIEDGEQEIDAGSAANTFYCSETGTIHPSEIQGVELV